MPRHFINVSLLCATQAVCDYDAYRASRSQFRAG